ncbi:hypothetical protein [Methylobacterium sp. CM6247]
MATRFFAYVNTNSTPEGRFPGYRDRPKKFLYDYLKSANAAAEAQPATIDAMRQEFLSMLTFVAQTFPQGFQKRGAKGAVPRVRFEAISIGSALALREDPQLSAQPAEIEAEMIRVGFDKAVVSDGANVRGKLEGRIDLVKNILVNQ